jgi:hypothetical protein
MNIPSTALAERFRPAKLSDINASWDALLHKAGQKAKKGKQHHGSLVLQNEVKNLIS